MQMTMTFSFDDASEASVFFGEMSALLSRTGSALAGLFKHPVAPITQRDKTPEECAEIGAPRTVDGAKDSSNPVEGASASTEEPKRGRGRPRGSAAKVAEQPKGDALDELLEARGEAAAAKAAEAAEAPTEDRTFAVSVEYLREFTARISKLKPGNSKHVMAALNKHGKSKIADLTAEERYQVWVDVKAIDEIGF